MDNLIKQAEPAIDELFQNDEDQLYEELAVRLKAMRADASVGGSFAPKVTYDGQIMGPLDDLRNFGKNFFDRVSKDAYNIVCGNEADDIELRNELVAAFNIGEKAVAAALAALLVPYLGLAAAVASVVATIAVRLFYRAGHGAMCDVWKSKLPATGG